jgi:hypothetical protein
MVINNLVPTPLLQTGTRLFFRVFSHDSEGKFLFLFVFVYRCR